MSYARQFARHAALTVATTVVTGVLFYALRIVLYQNLTPPEYGLFYACFSFVLIVQTVISFGFDPGLVPFVTEFREQRDDAAIKCLALGSLIPQITFALGGGLALIAFADPLAVALTGNADGAVLLRILVLHMFCVVLFKAGQQVLLGLQAIAWRNAADLARAVVCLGSVVVLFRAGFDARTTAVAYTLAAATEVMVQCLALSWGHRGILRARFTWRPDLVLSAFHTGKYLSVAFGGIVVFSSFDTLVITLVRRDLNDAAAYQIALPTVTILYSLMIAAGLSLLPTVKTMWIRNERAQLALGIEHLYEAAIAVMLPSGVLMACYSDVIMSTLFRRDILHAPDAFNILAAGGIAFFVAYLNLHVLAGINSPRAAAACVVAGLGIDLVCNPLLTHFYGIRGTAIAGVAGYGTTAAVGLYLIRRELSVRLPLRTFGGSVALSVLLVLLCLRFRESAPFASSPFLAAFTFCLISLPAGLLMLELTSATRLRETVRMLWPGVGPGDPTH